MNILIRRSALVIFCVSVVLALSSIALGQSITFNTRYSFEPAFYTEPPTVGGLEVAFPEEARKNGVEGTVKATMTLGEDGKIRDLRITQDLPFGVGDAVKAALEKVTFKPAMNKGNPIAMVMSIEYIVAMAYDEYDKNITKPLLTAKPEGVYPENQRAERVKGMVSVSVMFYADGTLKVVGASSVMPREFDKAAIEAAKNIKFTPAVHKKSKKPVSQQIIIPYEFKP